MIRLKDVVKYLKDNERKNSDPNLDLTPDQFKRFADAIYRTIKTEEAEMGEDYECMEDVDVGELIDGSDGGSVIREYGYRWLGLGDDDMDDDDIYDDAMDY